MSNIQKFETMLPYFSYIFSFDSEFFFRFYFIKIGEVACNVEIKIP